MKYIYFVIGISFLNFLQSCQSTPSQIDQITGSWSGVYEDYSYSLYVYPDLRYKLDLNETNGTSFSGKLILVSDSIRLIYGGENFFLKSKDENGDGRIDSIKILPDDLREAVPFFVFVKFKRPSTQVKN